MKRKRKCEKPDGATNGCDERPKNKWRKKMSFYFDNAATSFPKPECVYEFMDSFYKTAGANAGRGQYKISAATSKVIFETRELLQELLQCRNKQVIFTPSATLALNMLIQGIVRKKSAVETVEDTSKGNGHLDKLNDCVPLAVYISPFEHNAVTRTLHALEKQNLVKVNVLPIEKDFSYDFEKIARSFEKETPELLILSHVSNVCGLICPVEKLCSLAKKHNALTLIDMAQSAALVPIELSSDLYDFAVFAGHKTLLGPLGVSGFVANPQVLKEFVAPILFGGTGVDSKNQDMPDDLPARFEMGSVNIQAVAGLHAALLWWKKDTENIRQKEKENHLRLLEILKKYDFLKIVGPSTESRIENCTGVVSCVFENYSADEIGSVLDEKNIAVRTGLQCAPLAHKTLGTFPAGTVRFSTQYFTSDEAFDVLVRAMEYIKRNI